MSYRAFKRLMGETSLERKCRFLFGGGLMLLITGSFWFYGRQNANVVMRKNTETARRLVVPTLVETHVKRRDTPSADEGPQPQPKPGRKTEADRLFENPSAYFRETKLVADEENARTDVFRTDTSPDKPHKRAPDNDAYVALAKFRAEFPDTTEIQEVVTVEDQNRFRLYTGIRAERRCIACHYHRADGVQEGALIGVVRVSLPMKETDKALAANNVILVLTGLVTAVLAMLAAYAIVRYVIVKPVLHLKDISDRIARGMLDLRADIRTGDEFEELSHAFNRMLRHLVTVQDELREVNADLDAKVDELAHVNLQLYEMNKLKDEFLATMSHELRTPLNSILGFSDILAGAPNLNDKQKRYVQNITVSGQDLMARINDVLDLAKIESGKMDLQPVEFALSELVDRQVGSMLPQATNKNIELSTDVDDGLPELFQDSGKLQQILNNLLSNAIKFTPEGGRVYVRAFQIDDQPDFLELNVADTGVGIRLEEQETIFEKFRQGKLIPGQENVVTREYEGTGLGLSIVKELARLLGGEVELESEFGKGSMFSVRIPIRIETRALESHATRTQSDLVGTSRSLKAAHTPEGNRGLPTVTIVEPGPAAGSTSKSDSADADDSAA